MDRERCMTCAGALLRWRSRRADRSALAQLPRLTAAGLADRPLGLHERGGVERETDARATRWLEFGRVVQECDADVRAFRARSARPAELRQCRDGRRYGRPYGGNAAQHRNAASVVVVAVRGAAPATLRGARLRARSSWSGERRCSSRAGRQGRRLRGPVQGLCRSPCWRLLRSDVQQLAVLGTDPMSYQREVQRL